MNNETKHLKNSNSNKYIAPSLDTTINTKNNSKQKQSWREAKAIADVKLKKERENFYQLKISQNYISFL